MMNQDLLFEYQKETGRILNPADFSNLAAIGTVRFLQVCNYLEWVEKKLIDERQNRYDY